MGLNAPFNQGADFSSMTTSSVFISDVIHSAVLEVDESGVTAAAVTILIFLESAAMEPPSLTLFKADHPFMFYIVDKGANGELSSLFLSLFFV